MFFLRVNAVSLNCGTREVEDVKKRWKDAKTAVKKKESKRKSGLQKTGGGPPVDVTFRPWELDVSIFGVTESLCINFILIYFVFILHYVCYYLCIYS